MVTCLIEQFLDVTAKRTKRVLKVTTKIDLGISLGISIRISKGSLQ